LRPQVVVTSAAIRSIMVNVRKRFGLASTSVAVSPRRNTRVPRSGGDGDGVIVSLQRPAPS
jgi:hypothetical protein